jgi:DNA-binding transcriptional regulator GbsR (MarR family)
MQPNIQPKFPQFNPPFCKVEMFTILNAFKSYRLEKNERLLYLSMILFLNLINSNIIKASYSDLMEVSGLSKPSLMKALKSLNEKSFINKVNSKGRTNAYSLNIGAYNGQAPHINQGLSTGLSTGFQHGKKIDLVLGKKNDLVRAHVYNTNPCKLTNTKKKNNNKKESVVVFSPNSIFKGINQKTIQSLSEKHGSDHLKKVIHRLDQTYKHKTKIKTSLEALLIHSCQNPEFDSETQSEKSERHKKEKREDWVYRAEKRINQIDQEFKAEQDEYQRDLEAVKAEYPEMARNFKSIAIDDGLAVDVLESVVNARLVEKYRAMRGKHE